MSNRPTSKLVRPPMYTGVGITPVLDKDSGTDLTVEYHGERWNVLTLQGFKTVFVKDGVALMRMEG